MPNRRRAGRGTRAVVVGLLTTASALSCGGKPVAGSGGSGGLTGGQGGLGGVVGGMGGTGALQADGAVTDGSLGDASFAEDFAGRVRVVLAEGGTSSTCASPLPAVPVGGTDDARSAIRGFIAGVLGVAPDDLTLHTVECGTATTTSCASRFMHDLYKSNGSYGASLYPLAQELEARASFVEETIWTPKVNGITGAADVCFSGIVDGFLAGVCMFNEWRDCP